MLLEARHLSFRYPEHDSPEVLTDISFTLNRGEAIGIFGRTGAGKSTLFSVLTRLYNPKADEVGVDGRDALTFSLDDYRRHFAYASQRPFLFSDTIANNVAMGSAEPLTENDLLALLQTSAFDSDLQRFPQGLETIVGPRGITLSGGQRQRLSLARALASDAPILLLDDVLSAVDHLTEVVLIAHLYRRIRDRHQAMILSSHRISALKDAHQILVLEHGRITARGTHAELLATCDFYRHTWERQRLEAGNPPPLAPPWQGGVRKGEDYR